MGCPALLNFNYKCSTEGKLGGPAIELFVDLGGLKLLGQKEKVGTIDTSPCSSTKSNRMKARSGFHDFNFCVLEEELKSNKTLEIKK